MAEEKKGGISDKIAIRQVVRLAYEFGIRKAVVCPGSRNMPIVQTISACGLFEVTGVTDERSAGFVATGMAITSGQPVLVCVTSGSAVAGLLPAALECKYQRVPLLILTADRPSEWIDQMDGQTIHQEKTLAEAVSVCVDIDDLPSEEDPSYEQRLWGANFNINKALLKMTSLQPCPVQINLRLREPFFSCSKTELEEVRVIRRIKQKEALESWKECKRPLIILGQNNGGQWIQEMLKLEFFRGVPMYAEILSQTSPFSSNPFNKVEVLYIKAEDIETYNPDCAIYIGGHIVSKTAKNALRNNKNLKVVRVDTELCDTFYHTVGLIDYNDIYLGAFKPKMINYANIDFSKHLSEEETASIPKLYTEIMKSDLHNVALCIGNSTAVRMLDKAWVSKGRPLISKVLCNRGVNGIEGSMSAAVGVSLSTEQKTLLVIGDLSFFYDLNSLWIKDLPSNLVIIMHNNYGGGIFNGLAMEKTDAVKEYVMAKHSTNAREVAKTFGLRYFLIKNENMTSQWIDKILDTKSQKATLIEVTD